MRTVKWITLSIVILVFTLPTLAQKFAYVQSQRILSEYQEYVDVQNKLNEIRNGYDQEYQRMVKEYNDMIEEIDSQSLLLSPEKKQEKMKQAQEKALAIERYKYEKLGPEGELYKKSMEFTKPIIDKINKLIADIGEQEGYDFIFDASSGALVHALPKYDITDLIIEKLNKGAAGK
ncbi:MAG TPA: OmpH family outer membrane protein [Caldithrix abyssi]|uniref:OmpH family outer membrane protein n=1 Tax=Caldithrix abyssi TaxID=187145 RepID=A0A7V4UFH4_CALAY|nr:OmpH family outer membrane protein [Caldithrix abyssi]